MNVRASVKRATEHPTGRLHRDRLAFAVDQLNRHRPVVQGDSVLCAQGCTNLYRKTPSLWPCATAQVSLGYLADNQQAGTP